VRASNVGNKLILGTRPFVSTCLREAKSVRSLPALHNPYVAGKSQIALS
jgi:hypothetical protein